MATIEAYALSSGVQRYRVRYRKPDNRQTDKRGFKTKREAKNFASSVEVSKLKGEFVDISLSKATIGELGPDWLERKTGIKPSTRRTLESAWRVHVLPRWGSTPVSAIEFTAVQKWVSELHKAGKSPTTVKRVFGVLSSILDDAVKDRRILGNPCKGVNTPRKVAGEHTYLTHEELHKLADQAGTQGTMILTLGYCGLRWGEATGLRVKDLDFDRLRDQRQSKRC